MFEKFLFRPVGVEYHCTRSGGADWPWNEV